MTTIACDGKTLAADTQCTLSDLRTNFPKIYRTKWKGQEALIGGAGSRQCALALLEWLESGADETRQPSFGQEDLAMIMVTSEGMFLLESRLIPMKINHGFFAIGSGRDYALAAMACGKSAREACEVAAMFDIYTCGPFTELALSSPNDQLAI